MGLMDNFKKSLGFEDQSENINKKTVTEEYPDEEDYFITPDQTYYEIVLIKAMLMDDIDYVFDQVIEEKNPVVLDLSYFEEENEGDFLSIGEKIKSLRETYDAEAIILCKTEEKHILLITPPRVKIKIKD